MQRIKDFSLLVLIICSIIMGNNYKEQDNSVVINNKQKIILTSEIELNKMMYEESKKIIMNKYQKEIEKIKNERKLELNLLKQKFKGNIKAYKKNAFLNSKNKPIKLERNFIKN